MPADPRLKSAADSLNLGGINKKQRCVMYIPKASAGMAGDLG